VSDLRLYSLFYIDSITIKYNKALIFPLSLIFCFYITFCFEVSIKWSDLPDSLGGSVNA
jgi:hypothetical protein